MNTSVRINVRVAMGNAIAIFNSLRGQINSLNSSTSNMGGVLQQSSRAGASALDNMSAAGRRLVQTGRTLLYNFTIPLVGAFSVLERQALRNSEQFALLTQVYTTANGESAKFGQTTGRVRTELGKLDQIITVLSNTYGIAKDQVTALAVTFGRAGLAGADLAKSVKNAIVLMAGFQVNTEQATDAVLQLGESYKLNADQVAVASAVITDASQKTRADVQTLVAGFVKAAPAAALLGIKISTLADYLAVMQQAGFKGAESGTAMNFMFTRLNQATPKAIELFKHFGLNLNSAAYEAANGEKRLQMITKALGGLSDAQKAIAIGDLFGVRQYPKAIALVQDLSNATGLFVRLQKGQVDSTALLAEQQNALALAMDNSATKFRILKTQLINNFTIIANDLTPALLAITNLLVSGSRWFARLGDSAGGRTVQAFIVLAAAVLAVSGPIAILIGSFMQLIPLLEAAGGLIAAAFSPIGVALATIIALAIIFHKQFVAVMTALYRDILIIAKAIYAALQWINPFAHHSPSLVERTRDGIAAILGYWNQLTPIFGLMDKASAAMKALTASLAGFTAAQQKADLAKMRAAVVRVGGAKAGVAFDGVVAANAKLMEQLPVIQKQYTAQEAVVKKAKAALDEANASLDAANAKLKEMQSQRDAAADSLAKLGDPQALASQADAASNMARALSEAGNNDLAQQFQAQAMHLGDQAKKAGAAKAKLDEMDAAIKTQQNEIDQLTAARDALNATYDTEQEKLQAIADLYASVKDEIDANTAALQQMADAAQAAIDAATKAKGAGAGKTDPMEGFDNAAGGNFNVAGASALPGNLPPGTGGSLDKVLAEVNADQARTMQNLFPNPFRMFGKWIDEAKGLVHGFVDWLKNLATPDIKPSLPGHFGEGTGARAASAGQKIAQGARDIVNEVDWKKLAADAEKAWSSIEQGFRNAWSQIKGPLKDFGEAVRGTLGFLAKAGRDIADIFMKHLGPVLDGFAKFWADNGAQIGTIIGFIVGQVLDFGASLLHIANFIAKILWPVVKFTLDSILGVFEGLWKAIEGGLQFIIQILTGHFSKAFEGLGQMFVGLGQTIWNALKALGGLVVLALAGIAALILDELIAGLAEVGPRIVELGRKIPGWLWDALKLTWKGVVKLAEFVGDFLKNEFPAIAQAFETIASDIVSTFWKGVTEAWHGAVDLVQFIGAWIADISDAVLNEFEQFAAHIPGQLWDGFVAAWDQAWKFVDWYGTKINSAATAVGKATKDFASKIPGWLWEGLTTLAKGTKEVFQIADWMVTKFDGAEQVVAGAAISLARKIPGALWKGLTTLAKGAKDVLDIGGFVGGKIGAAVMVVANDAWSLGKSIVEGIAGAIVKFAYKVGDALVGAVKTAWNWATGWLDSHSPSRRAARELGAPISQGIAVGISAHADAVADSLVDTLRSAHQQAQNVAFASISLPALQQKVQLMYEGQMSSLPAMQAGVAVAGSDGAATGGDVTHNTTINVDATKTEASDPQALAAAIAWKQRTTVGY